MKTIHRIVIGALVVLFFTAGYATRTACTFRARELAIKRDATVEGTRIASARIADMADVDIRPLQTLYDVLRHLREHYVEQLTVENEGKMTYEGLRAMLASLADPNTRFIEPEQRKVALDAQEGKFHGIGAILSVKQTWRASKDKAKEPLSEERLVVATVLPDSPAAKAGLKLGDEIIAINGKSVLPYNPYQRVNELLKQDKYKNMERAQLRKFLEAEQKRIEGGISVTEAQELLGSKSEKPFELTLAAKPGGKETKVSVTPADLTLEPVGAPRFLADGTAYLKVNHFGAATAAKFAEAASEIKSRSATGLILDLRSATGGDITSAARIAGWLAPNRTLAVLLRSRGRKNTISPLAERYGEAHTWGRPVVVLVDGSTTRAPEVLAAGLRENGTAKLVGEQTYGAFYDTTMVDLADGSAIVMATGKYVTPKGVDYNGKGVPVDVKASAEAQQMKEAARLLSMAGGKG